MKEKIHAAQAFIPVSRDMRLRLGYPEERYDSAGRLIVATARDARELALRLAELNREHPLGPGGGRSEVKGRPEGGGRPESEGLPEAKGAPDGKAFPAVSPGNLYGAAWILKAWDLMLGEFRKGRDPVEAGALKALEEAWGEGPAREHLASVRQTFPRREWEPGALNPPGAPGASETSRARLSRKELEEILESWIPVRLAQDNPAFASFSGLFRESAPTAAARAEAGAAKTAPAPNTAPSPNAAWAVLQQHDSGRPSREPENAPPLATLRKPVDAAPFSVRDQLHYILTHWGSVLGDWAAGLLGALDLIEEETRPRFSGPGPAQKPLFDNLDGEARFSHDQDWMPRVVLIAKNILVWLHQLRESYKRNIQTLSDIPDEELDLLAARGFNALWLIGLWERSAASREIKQRMGNPEAAASAYSLYGYTIDPALGGWDALENLRRRAAARGIRLSSDMVPNHVGLDSDWVRHYPGRLLSSAECPFPAYSFNSDNLSGDSAVDIRIEDHYWNRSDAAVVFRREDRHTGEVRYIYHGNDGTSMPWNDTAQIDFLNPEAREAVIQDILHVARNFPIIRFDAAMVLARKSIRRLWFPAPGSGGAIPSRSEHALSDEEFMAAAPAEFWREVVDRVAAEVPGTLLLAEAFWMMEGYFVRSLGMHRVYNSAFMNMLRDGKNAEYREVIKETLTFDPGILQRYVNFMNNPDEETAVDQFGRDDRYFAVCTLLTTLPGLPMFGHGQVEGFTEKYGMEYVRAYRDEQPDRALVDRHEREIFPLMHRRGLFAGALSFRLYDLHTSGGVNENVFAYTNTDGRERVLVLVNNSYEQSNGNIHRAFPVSDGNGGQLTGHLGDALVPSDSHDDDWVLMREQVSGLWFLRRAGELRRRGLQVAITGYGRQVYLDFRYEAERPDGLWGVLASELNGGGTPNPDEALQAILLRPVHAALDGILSLSALEEMAARLEQGHRPRLPECSGAVARLQEARRSISGGVFTVGPEQLCRDMRRRLSAAARAGRPGGRKLRVLMNGLFAEFSAAEEARILVLWSVLAPLLAAEGGGQASANSPAGGSSGPSRLRDVWGLDYWLRTRGLEHSVGQAALKLKACAALEQVTRKPSALKQAARKPAALPRASTARKQVAQNQVARKPFWTGRKRHSPCLRDTGGFLRALFSTEDFRSGCGVNSWNGILWFDDYGWKRSARTVLLCAAFAPRPPFRRWQRLRVLRTAAADWNRAAAASDYRLDALLNALRR